MDFLVKAPSDSLQSRHEKHKRAARYFGVTLGALETDEAITVKPVVNHGRWIIRCPWCASAELAGEWFFCSQGCFNGAVGRKYVKVDWPKQREAIERILLKRPDPQTRNWTTESIDDLARENDEHGVGKEPEPEPIEPVVEPPQPIIEPEIESKEHGTD